MQFRDLAKQYEFLKDEIDSCVRDVCSGARFISGREVKELEEALADYVGVKHCITCANGTDAITLALKSMGLGKGDAVFVPDFTFFSSGECPAAEGCACVFVDVCASTFNIDPEKLEEAVVRTKEEGKYSPKAVIAVDLFGLAADYDRIRNICDKYDLMLIEDAAQGFGASLNGKKTCSFGDISTTSFFPAKPLGCYGDGGAVFTDNDEWAKTIRSLAVHGKSGDDKYNNVRIGMNSRLDTIQAAILLVKLKAFADHELADINTVADMYRSCMEEYAEEKGIVLPRIPEGYVSSYAQFTIRVKDRETREKIQSSLKEKGIPTMVYYMKPMHSQGAFAMTESANAVCPVTEKHCDTVLSLPIHPYMTKEEVKSVVEAIRDV